jgi:hypothetical protein
MSDEGIANFVKSFEMLEWLLNHKRGFPKHQRFVMVQRMEQAALSFWRATCFGVQWSAG